MTPISRRYLCAAAVFGAAVPAFAEPAFTPQPGVRAALQARQTGVFRIADFGPYETLLLLVNGVAIDLHLRRRGIYQQKDPARSRSVKTVAPVDLNRLIAAAGGLDQPVNGGPRAAGFFAVYKALPANVSLPPARTQAAGAMTPLTFSRDPAFDGWTFERDARADAYAVSLPGIKAFWILEGTQ